MYFPEVGSYYTHRFLASSHPRPICVSKYTLRLSWMAQKYSLARSLRIFHQVHYLISFPQETWTLLWKPSLHTHMHTHTCTRTHTHAHTHTHTYRSLSLHTADVEDSSLLNWLWGLNSSWSQTCFHDSSGHRLIPSFSFQAGRSWSPAFPSLDSPCRLPGHLEPGLGVRQEPVLQQWKEQKGRLILTSLNPFSATASLVPGGDGKPEAPSSVQFSRSVVSNSLQPHVGQHAKLPCPSPIPGAYSTSCPSHRWCHQTISSSVVPFSSCFNLSQHQGLFQWVGSSH